MAYGLSYIWPLKDATLNEIVGQLNGNLNIKDQQNFK